MVVSEIKKKKHKLCKFGIVCFHGIDYLSRFDVENNSLH